METANCEMMFAYCFNPGQKNYDQHAPAQYSTILYNANKCLEGKYIQLLKEPGQLWSDGWLFFFSAVCDNDQRAPAEYFRDRILLKFSSLSASLKHRPKA